MKSVSTLSKVGAAVALAMTIAAPGVAHADAVSHAYIDISSFTFRIGNGVAGSGGTTLGAGGVTVLTATGTGDTQASLNGNTPTSGAGNSQVCQDGGSGACATYAGQAFTNPALPTGTYVGSTSSQLGDSTTLPAGATARTDDYVSLNPVGTGSANSNAGLSADFRLSVPAGTILEVAFDARAFLRAMLTGVGNSQASNQWIITLERAGLQVFSWAPGGTAGGISGGTEYADPFALNDATSRSTAGNSVKGTGALGHFEAETASLAAGEYTVTITQKSSSDARLAPALPEPGTISLISLALLGIGAMSRRRKA